MNLNRLKTLPGLLVLATCWVASEGPTIRHGCDLTDFGQAATIAHRLAHGDRPFVDCMVNAVSLAEYYASWLFWLKPNATLLDLRIANSAVEFGAYVAVYLVLCGLARPSVSLLCTAASIPVVRVWYTQVPSYNSLPATAAILSIALYWAALRRYESRSRYTFAFVGGLVGGLAATCRLPLIGLAGLPAVFLIPALAAGIRRREALASAIAYVLGHIVVLSIAAGVIIQAGLAAAAVERFLMVVSRGHYGTESITLLGRGVRDIAHTGVVAANYVAVFVLLMSLATARFPKWLRIILAAAAAIMLARHLGVRSAHTANTLGFELVGVTLGLIAWWPRRNLDHEARLAAAERSSLCMVAVFMAILFMAGSNTGPWAAAHGSHLLAALSILLILELPGRVRSLGKTWFVSPVVNRVATVSMVAAVVGASFHWWITYGSYRDMFSVRHPERQVPFRSAALAGLTSTAKRVDAVDRLVERVRQRVRPGGYILAYYDVPLVYFATGTRPAVCASWVMENWPAPLEQQVLADMLRRSRIPELVIRNRVFPGRRWPACEAEHRKRYTDDTFAPDTPERRPINAWVEANYDLTDPVGPFEVWLPKNARPSEGGEPRPPLASADVAGGEER
ncbi:MAG: hypothetical protein ACE5F9_00040 [Phycisphaerae bacterium]